MQGRSGPSRHLLHRCVGGDLVQRIGKTERPVAPVSAMFLGERGIVFGASDSLGTIAFTTMTTRNEKLRKSFADEEKPIRPLANCWVLTLPWLGPSRRQALSRTSSISQIHKDDQTDCSTPAPSVESTPFQGFFHPTCFPQTSD